MKTISFDQIAEFNKRVFRNIQGKLADEFDDLSSSPSARALAHRVVANSPRTLLPQELHFHAIDFVFKQTTWLPSRFCNGTFPVWYGSVDLQTSFYETAYHWQRTFIEAPQGFQQEANETLATSRSVFTVACHAALIDLRHKIHQHKELIHPDTSRYNVTQTIGDRIHQEGYPGLLTPSARHPNGENVVIFRRNILNDPQHYQDFIYEYHFQKNKMTIKQSDNDRTILSI